MIQRTYFMLFEKTLSDGSTAKISFTLPLRTWFPHENTVHNAGTKQATQKLSHMEGGPVFCLAFNRV